MHCLTYPACRSTAWRALIVPGLQVWPAWCTSLTWMCAPPSSSPRCVGTYHIYKPSIKICVAVSCLTVTQQQPLYLFSSVDLFLLKLSLQFVLSLSYTHASQGLRPIIDPIGQLPEFLNRLKRAEDALAEGKA